MPMKKLMGAMVAGVVVQFVGLSLIHSVWLKQDYANTASAWRTPEAMNARVWAMVLSVLIYVVAAPVAISSVALLGSDRFGTRWGPVALLLGPVVYLLLRRRRI